MKATKDELLEKASMVYRKVEKNGKRCAPGARNLGQFFGFLDCGRWSNAERERHKALLGRDRLGMRKQWPDKDLLREDGVCLRGS
jgi:hypothetical protein